jgi:hypothetical protein
MSGPGRASEQKKEDTGDMALIISLLFLSKLSLWLSDPVQQSLSQQLITL